MEIDSNDLITKIFSKSPENKNAIQLSFVNQLDVKDLFEFLLTFFTEGSKVRYGNTEGKVDLASWTDKEMNKMKCYTESIGFHLIIDVYSDPETRLLDFNLMNYKNTKINHNTPLKELKFPIRCGANVFVISFDFYL